MTQHHQAPHPRAQLLAEISEVRGNSFLLCGTAYLGKSQLALDIAIAQNCQQPWLGNACGTCESCRLDPHPDILWVKPKTTTSTGKVARRKIIPIGAISAQRASKDDTDYYEHAVFEFLQTRASFRRKVVILEGAEYTTTQAANALLKLMEEPPHGALFILTAEDATAVLPTIKSRSVVYTLTPLSPNNMPTHADENAELLAFAAGRPRLLDERDAVQAALTAANLWNNALRGGLLEALEATKTLEASWGAWHITAIRWIWRHEEPLILAELDQLLEDLQAALEQYASPTLMLHQMTLEARRILQVTP